MKRALLSSIIIILFSACAYQAKKISQIEKSDLVYKNEIDNLEISLNVLDPAGYKQYFDKYTCLHLQIKNKSTKTYNLNHADLELPLVCVEELKKNVPNVILSYFIPSLAFLAGGILFFWQICLPLASLSAAVSLFYGKTQNKNIIRDLNKTVLNPEEDLKILPDNQINKLLFIKKEFYTPKFNLTLKNPKDFTDFLTFRVLIAPQKSIEYKIC